MSPWYPPGNARPAYRAWNSAHACFHSSIFSALFERCAYVSWIRVFRRIISAAFSRICRLMRSECMPPDYLSGNQMFCFDDSLSLRSHRPIYREIGKVGVSVARRTECLLGHPLLKMPLQIVMLVGFVGRQASEWHIGLGRSLRRPGWHCWRRWLASRRALPRASDAKLFETKCSSPLKCGISKLT